MEIWAPAERRWCGARSRPGLGRPGFESDLRAAHLRSRLTLYHFDAWRLAGPGDLEAIGAEDYLEGDGVAVVEWSERAQGLLPGERLEVYLERCPAPEQRRLRLVGLGPRGAEILEGLE